MAIKIPPPPNTEDTSIWQDWYIRVKNSVNTLSESLTWTSISKVGSNLTDILTRNHNDLQNIQGGGTTERYHLTSAQQSSISSGITVTITTYKITPGGANGSMTFTNGILTSQTQAT